MRQGTKNTAFHEASHAVVGLRLGLTPASATIVRDRKSRTLGAQRDLYEDDIRHNETTGAWEAIPSAYKAHIVSLYAGRAGEAMLAKVRTAGRAFAKVGGDCSDREKAALRIRHLWADPVERRRRRRRYQRLALWLVWRYHDQVERVAEALLRLKTLDMDGIEIAAAEGVDAVVAFRRRFGLSK